MLIDKDNLHTKFQPSIFNSNRENQVLLLLLLKDIQTDGCSELYNSFAINNNIFIDISYDKPH